MTISSPAGDGPRGVVPHPGAKEIVAGAQSAAFAIDLTGTIRHWNQGATELLGHPAPWAVGRKLYQVLEPRDAAGNRFPIDRIPFLEMALRGEPINSFEATLRPAAGARVRVKVAVVVVLDRGPSDHEIVCLLQPMHRRRRSDEVIERLLATPHWPRRAGHGPATELPSPLTARQGEVLDLLADGHSAPRIAEELAVSVHTVRNHIQAIFQKLEVHSRVEAVAKAYKRGLI